MPPLYAAEALEQRLLLAVLYVDLNAPGPVHDGSSWDCAYTDLQPALTNAKAGDQIHIAGGTYKPTATSDRRKSFQLKSGVALYGGYSGRSSANPALRNLQLFPTVLSGEIGDLNTTEDNSYHVVCANGVDATAILDGLIITAGNANGDTDIVGSTDYLGGGMYISQSSPTLTNCSFVGNSAAYNGAGLYNFSSLPTLSNCSFVGNFAAWEGGGMYNEYSSSPTLTNCIFVANCALSRGGGMCNDGSSSLTLTNCIVWGNSSAIYNYGIAPTVTCCDIQGGYIGTGNLDADPQFFRSPWPGPDGVFGTTDDDYGDLRLRAGSPALNNGSNAAVPAGLNTDLGNHPRIQSGTVDMGVYEGAVTVPAPRILYVDQNATGANTGISWSDAYTSLQSALAVSVDGDTIRIADGTYKPTTTTNRAANFALRNAVAIYGGYAGSGASNPEVRDVATYPTILSGDISKPGDKTDNSYHVITALGVGSSMVLDGTTITLGHTKRTGTDQDTGGGLYLQGSSPTLINCRIVDNSASSGGGMYNSSSSSPTLTNCSFVGNSAFYGGGMCNTSSSTPQLTNCSFIGNSGPEAGGGMYNLFSSPTLTNCSFVGNSAFSGAGMYNRLDSSPMLTNCSLVGNSATTGGGMYNDYSCSPTLTNCGLVGNSASGGDGGGAMYNYARSSPTLTNCIVWGNNSSQHRTSDIYNLYSIPAITYSLIQRGYIGVGNLDADPQFVRNPSSGPDGKWATTDDDYGDLRLQKTSPAINAGNNAALPSNLTTDLAGKPRLVGGTVDLGAYEYQNDELALVGSAADSFHLRIAGSTLEVFRNTPPDQAPPTQSIPLSSLSRLRLQGGQYTLASNLAGLELYLENDSQVKLASSQRLGVLSFSPTAVLDLADHDLIVNASPETKQAVLAAISNAIKSARGSEGQWQGTGLTSSAAQANHQTGLAVMLNEKDGKPILTTFDGQSVNENDILVKYTWNGDVDLNGVIDGDDYFLVDSGFISQLHGYQNGDVNFDGVVDGDDYFLIDSAFITQAGMLAEEEVPVQTEGVGVKAAAKPPSQQTLPVLAQLFSAKPVL